MADDILHSRAISPWFVPNKGGSADDLHGLTDLGVDPSVASEDVYVVGKKVKCATDKEIPEVTIPLTQFERGTINAYKVLANLDAEPSGGFDLLDFNSSLTDVIYYLKDEFDGDLFASIWSPKASLNSITLNIDDPEARITREFELSSDDRQTLLGANKYLIHTQNTAPSGTSGNYVISTADPAPVVHPTKAGVYILRLDRTRAGVTTTLTLTTDYTYSDGSKEITVLSALTGDVYNIYYSASSFGSAGDPTTVDADSTCFLKAENVTILISDGSTEVELDRLSSLTLTATLNRIDENALGNDERVFREISDTPVTLDISGRIKDFDEEKAFMTQIGDDDVISSVKEFADNVKVTIKIYDSADKDTFLIGYQVANLSYTDGSLSVTANDFAQADLSASSDNILITTTEGDL